MTVGEDVGKVFNAMFFTEEELQRGSLSEAREDAERALGRTRQTAGLRGAREGFGDTSGRR